MKWQLQLKSALQVVTPHIKRELSRHLNNIVKSKGRTASDASRLSSDQNQTSTTVSSNKNDKRNIQGKNNSSTRRDSTAIRPISRASQAQNDRSSAAQAKGVTVKSGADYRHGCGPNGFPSPDETPVLWDFKTRGLPRFDYRPAQDGAPDPGEIVWTWVPFEENDGRGKDRPVLVVAMEDDYVIFGQMTSKDHAQSGVYRDKFDRWWIDLGSGTWDAQRRPSEMRLDLLWIVHVDQVRRGGGQLSHDRFATVVGAIQKINGE